MSTDAVAEKKKARATHALIFELEYIAANKDVFDNLLLSWQQSREKSFLSNDTQWHSKLEKIHQDLLSG